MTLASAPGGAWNGESGAIAHGGSALVWLPPDARLHEVVLRPENGTDVSATWRAEGPAAIRIASPVSADGARLVAAFDLPRPSASRLVDYVAPSDITTLAIDVTAPDGKVVQLVGGDAVMHGVKAGAIVSIRIVDADAVGELPLLVALVLVAIVVLAGTLAWHAYRPPAARARSDMRFLDHLGELQARLVPPILVFAFLNGFYFVAGLRLVHVGRAAIVTPWLSDTASLSQQAYQAIACFFRYWALGSTAAHAPADGREV